MTLSGRRVASRPPTRDVSRMSRIGSSPNASPPVEPLTRKTMLTAMMNTTATRLAATPTTASRGGRGAGLGSRSLVTGWLFTGKGEEDRFGIASRIGIAEEDGARTSRNRYDVPANLVAQARLLAREHGRGPYRSP